MVSSFRNQIHTLFFSQVLVALLETVLHRQRYKWYLAHNKSIQNWISPHFKILQLLISQRNCCWIFQNVSICGDKLKTLNWKYGETNYGEVDAFLIIFCKIYDISTTKAVQLDLLNEMLICENNSKGFETSYFCTKLLQEYPIVQNTIQFSNVLNSMLLYILLWWNFLFCLKEDFFFFLQTIFKDKNKKCSKSCFFIFVSQDTSHFRTNWPLFWSCIVLVVTEICGCYSKQH